MAWRLFRGTTRQARRGGSRRRSAQSMGGCVVQFARNNPLPMYVASLLVDSPWMFVDLSSLALSLASRGPRSCSEFPSRATNRVPVLASAFPGTLSLLLRRVYRLPRHRRSLPAPRSSLTWFGVRSAVSASSAPVAPGLLACSRWRFVWLACSLEVHERSLGRPAKRLSEQARKASCVTNRLFRPRKSSLCLPREQTSLANSSSQTPRLFVWLARSLAGSRKLPSCTQGLFSVPQGLLP